MSAVEDLSRRRGGRDARRALRSRPIPMAEAAVRPGMEGGQYKPLTDHEMQRIHQTALKLLETVGLAQAIPSCVEAMTAKGCWINAQGRLCIPASLVEDTLASCARNFVLHGRDPKHDMEPSGNKVYFGTAGAAVHVVEPETKTYRESVLVDLYDAGRIVDNCEHIHFYQRPLTARDMLTGHDLDINTMYACLAGTEKHVGTSMVDPAHVDECLQILHVLAGGEDVIHVTEQALQLFKPLEQCLRLPPLQRMPEELERVAQLLEPDAQFVQPPFLEAL